AAHQREAAQDPALAGACQRVLEVDRGMHGTQHHLARRQVVDAELLDAGAVTAVVAADAECAEAVGDAHGPASFIVGAATAANAVGPLPPRWSPQRNSRARFSSSHFDAWPGV